MISMVRRLAPADVLDLDLAVADPAERLVKGLVEAGARVSRARERQLTWELERELLLLRLVSSAASASGGARTGGGPSDVHSVAAMRERARALHSAHYAPAPRGADMHGRQTLSIGKQPQTNPADVLLRRLEARAAQGASGNSAHERIGANVQCTSTAWSAALYELRPGHVWYRADVSARFAPNLDALSGAPRGG